MYEKLDECPSCGHTQFKNHMICEDHSATHESFALVKCMKCSLVFTNPRPTSEHIDKYYQHDNYISHTNAANNFTNLLYKIVRHITLRKKKKLIKEITHNKRILDFGCGTGTFLEFMNSSGYDCIGFEPSSNANNSSVDKSFKIHTQLTDLKKEEPFDIITAWHVLEHVHDLKQTIKALRQSLSKSGILIIAVPNIKSFDSAHYKEKWAAYDVPRHLYHFSQESIIPLMQKHKFHLNRIHPMRFDSYYVSMLSEQHIGSKLAPIKGFFTGLKSNRSAKQTKEYSSLIYIFNK